MREHAEIYSIAYCSSKLHAKYEYITAKGWVLQAKMLAEINLGLFAKIAEEYAIISFSLKI